MVDKPNILPNLNQKIAHPRKNKSKPQIARQPGEEPFLRNRRCLGQNCAEDHAMLRKLTLVTASVAGVVSATATWAKKQSAPSLRSMPPRFARTKHQSPERAVDNAYCLQ
jgi:hypothetical protein